MVTFTLKIPAVFGDHHTNEIRRILSELNGVKGFDVSCAFNEVRIEIDPKATNQDAVEQHLRHKGYASGEAAPRFFSSQTQKTAKHTEVESDVIAFHEAEPSWAGGPLWPCPGLEYQPTIDEQ